MRGAGVVGGGGEAPEAPEAVAVGRVSGYRPHLDGLRAVAVYLVVLFHAGVDRFAGGFIGVDVFFVLSGYLVTQMLMRDVTGEGGIRFSRFYSRRFRRLLPASAAALVGTAAVYAAVAGPGQAADAVGAFRASFLYVANWYFIRESAGYFGENVAQAPVLQFWSLAIEEQFYLVWPLLLSGLYALARRARTQPDHLVRIVLAVAALASLAWALSLQGSQPDRAYYGTDTRAYQLLAGALLALTPGIATRIRTHPRAAPAISTLAAAAIVVLATSALDIGPITRGALTVTVAVTVVATLEAAPRGPLHRLLSAEPVVYLGKISYGIYLWHWPVIVTATLVADPSSADLVALTIPIATGLASLSYHLLEMPIRISPNLDRLPKAVIAAGLTISLIGALLITPIILERPQSSATPTPTTPTTGFTPLPTNLDLDAVYDAKFGETVDCTESEPSDCTVVEGSGEHILLMGDSNAKMMIPAFTALAEQQDLTLTLSVHEGCVWQRGRRAPYVDLREKCEALTENAYERLIPELDPDIIVAVNTEYPPVLHTPEKLREATIESVPQLTAGGRTLVLVEPIVQSPPEPLECLVDATFVEDCRFVADTTPSEVELLYREVADADESVVSADLDTLACPYLPICDPVVGGEVVRWDHQHLAEAYSATLGDELAAYFKKQGLIGS